MPSYSLLRRAEKTSQVTGKKKGEGKETKQKYTDDIQKVLVFHPCPFPPPTRRSQSSATRGLRYPAKEVVSVDVL